MPRKKMAAQLMTKIWITAVTIGIKELQETAQWQLSLLHACGHNRSKDIVRLNSKLCSPSSDSSRQGFQIACILSWE